MVIFGAVGDVRLNLLWLKGMESLSLPCLCRSCVKTGISSSLFFFFLKRPEGAKVGAWVSQHDSALKILRLEFTLQAFLGDLK